ncbi:hypothetical protein KDM41_07295 [bacterium]|nr:hypothetical protein [bacterium]
MSANASILSRRPVIAVVLVLLAVVVWANARTFGPRRVASRDRHVRVQAAPPFPTDVGEVLRRADASPGAEASRAPLPDLRRDPFVYGAAAPATVAVAKPEPSRRAARSGEPVCEAVFPGGRDPLAVIGGRPCRLGDRVEGWTLVHIGIDGVRLARGDRERQLKVGETTDVATHHLVTSVRSDEQGGRTRLADPERNDP